MEAPQKLIDMFKFWKIWKAKNATTFTNPVGKYDENLLYNGTCYHILCVITEADVKSFNAC